EIAVCPRFSRSAEICGQDAEVNRVYGAVKICVTGERVSNDHGCAVDGLAGEASGEGLKDGGRFTIAQCWDQRPRASVVVGGRRAGDALAPPIAAVVSAGNQRGDRRQGTIRRI